jgi:hypothetical protein
MGILDKLKRKPEPAAGRRRMDLLATGRITDGVIIDTDVAPDGREIVFYMYTLNGVDFESSELLSPEQSRDSLRYAPGAKVGVRYDPKNQGNSTLD